MGKIRLDVNRFNGKVFGKLTILRFDSYKKPGKAIHSLEYFLCACDCGNEKIICGRAVTSGNTKSCGCSYIESRKKNSISFIKPDTGFNCLFSNYKRSAIVRKKTFNLSKEEFKKLTKQDCYYCGDPLSYIKTSRSISTPLDRGYVFNGIDRVDSSIGYELSNCITCCGICNKMKMVLGQEVFLNKIKQIYKYLFKHKDLAEYNKHNSLEQAKQMINGKIKALG